MNYSEEDRIEIACVQWFRYQYPHIIIHHTKNEGNRQSLVMKRNGKSYSPDGTKNKAMGVHPGFADLQIVRAIQVPQYIPEMDDFSFTTIHGLFVEVKSPTGTQSKPQKEFEQAVTTEGYRYRLVRSLDEFMQVVNEYLT